MLKKLRIYFTLTAVLLCMNTVSAVKIGVLHSLSGTMAISETSLRDVVLMAVDEINKKGGVLGEKIEPVVVDPASDWPLFAEKAKQLILEDKVAVTFGCWTSVSRKSCLPVFEEYNQLLFYPVQYEGEEQSLNVFYTAASPNQQLVPAAEYMMSELNSKKFYLLGTDYVFPRTANKVLKAFLKTKGVPDENIIEEYTPFHHQDYQTIVGKIKAFAASGDACVLSTINILECMYGLQLVKKQEHSTLIRFVMLFMVWNLILQVVKRKCTLIINILSSQYMWVRF